MTRTTRTRSRRPRRHGDAGRREYLGAAAAALLILATLLFAFARQNVSVGGTEIRAQFATANQLKDGSVVRRAGLDIGKVTAVQATDAGQALVTMRLNDRAPRLASDVELAIKPRLAFEGNFYIDVQGGTPGLPPLRAGDIVPQRNTSTPVQLDEVLNVFSEPVRESAKTAISELSAGLGLVPRSGSDRGAGYRSLRRASRELNLTLRPLTRAARAAQGTRAGDLPNAIEATSGFAQALGRDPRALADLVTNYRSLVSALAENDAAVSATMREAAQTLEVAPRSLARLDAALPPVRRLSAALRPTLRVLPATARATTGALDQIEALSGPRELPAATRALTRPVKALPDLEKRLRFIAPLVTGIGRCLSDTVVPVLNARVPDGDLSIDQPVWLELLHAGAGLAGGSPDFDANGTTFRAGLGASEQGVDGVIPGIGAVSGLVSPDIQGVRPVWLGANVFPTKRPDQACADQERVELKSITGTAYEGMNLRKSARPAPTRAQIDGGLRRLRDSLTKQIRDVRRAAKKRVPSTRPTQDRSVETPAPAAPPAPGRRPSVPVPPSVERLLEGLIGPSTGSRPSPGPSGTTGGILDFLLGD